LERTVVVQPSIYGTDNSCTLDAVRQLGESGRGVAVIDGQAPDAMLDDLDRAGVRGARLNLVQSGVTDPAVARQRFQALAERLAGRKWHIQIYTHPSIIETIHDEVMASPVPVVFDHFGGALAADGLQQPGFAALLSLVGAGKAYVKISGAADLISTQAPDYADVAPLARALSAANPQRILWATNWPHPDTAKPPTRPAAEITPLLRTDDARILNLLPEWFPDAATRALILVENPARLYGF
jgi:predicted TIM-barrel fold metal-dependent hydrolase